MDDAARGGSLRANTARGNSDQGFTIQRVPRLRLVGNLARRNGDRGFFLYSGRHPARRCRGTRRGSTSSTASRCSTWSATTFAETPRMGTATTGSTWVGHRATTGSSETAGGERPTRRARRGRRDGERLARQRLLHGATSEQASLTWVVQAESRRVGSVRPCYVAPSGLQAPASRPRPDATAHRRLSGVRPHAHRSRLPHNP